MKRDPIYKAFRDGDLCGQDRAIADQVRLTPKLAGIIGTYHEHDVVSEFRRLVRLALWDCGRKRWRGANNPVAYLATAVMNMARATRDQERPLGYEPLDSYQGIPAPEGSEFPFAGPDLSSLDADSTAVIRARSEGATWRSIAEAWGGDSRRVEAARGRLRRLRMESPPQNWRAAGDGRVYHEPLNNSGHWCFSFEPTNFTLVEGIVRAERKNIFSIARPKTPLRPLMSNETNITMPDLHQRLSTEQAKLDRILERIKKIRATVAANNSELGGVRNQIAAELHAAPLEEREPNVSDLHARVAELEAQFAPKRAELEGAESAAREQRQVIHDVTDQIASLHRGEVIAQVKPLSDDLVTLQNEYVRKSLELRLAIAGEDVAPSELFATGENWETVRARYQSLCDASGWFLNQLCAYNPRMRGELFKQYPGHMPENWAVDA